MKSKRIKYQRTNFKALSKAFLTILLSIGVLIIANGQTSYKEKIKAEKRKDSIAKSKVVTTKSDKLVVVDTIKKSKPLVEQETQNIDSLNIGTGKFKFYKKGAHASYYADKFHDKRTASGKKYDMNRYTAAHKKFPFGTLVKVTNEANGKSVIVEITDRGPFVRSREIDLSKRAFMEIAKNKSSGNMIVTMEVLQK